MYTEKDYNTGELNLLTMEREYIVKWLKLCRGHRNAAARVLGISERTIYHKIEKHQIKKDEYIN
jgi:DNA-binding NtrC family response regulator